MEELTSSRTLQITRQEGKFILIFIFIFGTLFFAATAFAPATSCWSYTTNAACTGDSSCNWRSDNWGGWCEEKGCWNYMTSATCPSSVPGTTKNCTWHSGNTWAWCESIGCWSYSGTNASACANNSGGMSCGWRGECMNTGGSYASCWSITDTSTCSNTTGCSWGNCYQQSCWDYSTQATCSGHTGYSGGNCTWNSQYSYCNEQNCGDYANQSACTIAPSSMKCLWKNGYCSKTWCSDFSNTNQSGCTNSTANLSCTWSNPWCNDLGCWNYQSQNTCSGQNSCTWKTSIMSGWCEEVQCWSWDSWSGGNANTCENNTYGMNCRWQGRVAGNTTDGWCYKDVSSVTCNNLTTERACMDTFYCWWQYTNWDNPSLGGTCNTPGSFGMTTNTSFFDEWNPGCYIFDSNQSACVNITGCTWSSAGCSSSTKINSTGLHCNYINDSTLCNNVPALAKCCTWQSGQCQNNTYSTSCRDDMQEPPEGASFCGDYNSYTNEQLCKQIANSPWFMPCRWDNSTLRCEFKSSDVFGSGTESLIIIDNKKACESAGGKWLTENYCEGNISVPTGRCEYKFNDETNCDKACYACEYKSDGTRHNSTKDATDACTNSKLGFCSFTTGSSAPNGYGYCKAKDEFKKGIATDCKTDCGACTFKGNTIAAESKVGDICKKPSCFCESSAANCKWIPDPAFPTDESKGFCASSAEQTCTERCDKCYDQNSCTQFGKGGSSNCMWNSATLVCEPTTSGGSASEICWDGTDNDNNGKMDCADSKCFSDPFCGGGSMTSKLNCAGFATNNTCIANNCTWTNETWWQGCDMPGMDCWKYDGSQSQCLVRNATCDWHSGFGGFCEQNWTMTNVCMGQNQATCNGNNASGCVWNADTWCQNFGGNCAGQTSTNYDCGLEPYYGNSTLCLARTGCMWNNASWCGSSGWCDHASFSCWKYNTQAACGNTSSGGGQWCSWHNDQYSPSGGWCETTANCMSYNTQPTCASNNCTWKAGFCDPKGFGGEMMPGSAGGGGEASGGFGISCYKYDGNQSGCANQTGCGWFSETRPTCDVDFSSDCQQYSYNATLCGQQPRCKWKTNTFGGWCENRIFECNSNQSLQTAANCTANSACIWRNGMCESGCFNTSFTTSQSCLSFNVTVNSSLNVSACKWTSGWCNPAMATQMFTGMEGGAPTPLGTDASGDAYPSDIDITGFGMKDMVDSYGFGAGTVNFRNASACNGVWMPGGTGTGTDTVKFFFYLDTDGSSTGNCALKHDANAGGYEFYFRYESKQDNTTGKATETLAAYKCTSGSWGPADIKLSSWPMKMCNEIQGGMVAVEKGDLKKFPTLYNTSADIRVLVTSANATMNVTSPTDTATAGWTTPGAIDFEIQDFFKYGADTAKFEDILKKGFVQSEDCFNSVDDDGDGLIDCNDYGCQYAKKCTGLGVNAAGYSDTKAPQVVGVKTETYTDSALIMYDTNKPANGTLLFYRNDSQCDTLNASILDIGILRNNTVRAYKEWHTAEIFNSTNSLNYILASDATYYYRLKVCDSGGKCGQSRCSNFTTSSATRCGYCNFVTRIKVPTGWLASYDADQNGVYEHVQGRVCGANSGVKTNYTEGRKANIMLNETSGSRAYIEFINVSLTRTGLNDKVRSVNGTSSLILNSTATNVGGATIGYVGMVSETRDKIINNLHPEVCRIGVPKGTTSCTELWHCDDNGANCINRTAESTLINSTSSLCIWQIPFCEFSVWAGGQPATPPGTTTTTTSSGGGGGGGGGGATGISETKSTPAIPEGGSATIVFTKTQIAITTMEIFAKKAIAAGTVTVATASKPTNVAMPVSNETGSVYKYLDITAANISDENISKVIVKFNVNKTWISANELDVNTISLQRYSNGIWTRITPEFISEGENFRLYKAESPGLSLFAITGDKNAAQQLIEQIIAPLSETAPPAEIPVPAETPPAEEKGEVEAAPPFTTSLIIVIIAVIITAAFGWSYFHRHPHIWKSGKHAEK